MPWSDYISSPTSYRERVGGVAAIAESSATFRLFNNVSASADHPNFAHLTLLVFEAVLEVVCVSLPGYIVARQGMFDAEAQKFVANLNVMLFTPCLIFTKLASQLSADKLQELAIIPLIFITQTAISFLCATATNAVMRFNKRQRCFVIAMAVFGNSNSLPISLVISLSKTLKGLHWDKIPGDNDNEVAARGILYLLIFQQLGQLLRWTWGYNVLLAPADRFSEEEGGTARASQIERGRSGYKDVDANSERQRLLSPTESDRTDSNFDDAPTQADNSPATARAKSPAGSQTYGSTHTSSSNTLTDSPGVMPTPTNGNTVTYRPDNSTQHSDQNENLFTDLSSKLKGRVQRSRDRSVKLWRKVPWFIRVPIARIGRISSNFLIGLWAFMNPPLWAMLVAIIVASVPQLQNLFFHPGSFIRNSVTRAVEQNAGVAVPLILVVLGGNLARNTLPKDDHATQLMDAKEERKLLIASLISRLVLPTILMAPLLAVTVKFVPVSILDDKIFIIVCFLLTGAPTALQLAQICQLNNVYMSVMSNILFQSYVIWLLPSTLILVLLSLETVTWAEMGR